MLQCKVNSYSWTRLHWLHQIRQPTLIVADGSSANADAQVVHDAMAFSQSLAGPHQFWNGPTEQATPAIVKFLRTSLTWDNTTPDVRAALERLKRAQLK